jgi:hypothetical protein
MCVLGATLGLAVTAIGFCTRAISAPGHIRNLQTPGSSSSINFVGGVSNKHRHAGTSRVLDGTATARSFFAGNGEEPAKQQLQQKQQQQQQEQQVQAARPQPPAWVLVLSAITALGFTLSLIYVVSFVSAAIFGVAAISGQQ